MNMLSQRPGRTNRVATLLASLAAVAVVAACAPSSTPDTDGAAPTGAASAGDSAGADAPSGADSPTGDAAPSDSAPSDADSADDFSLDDLIAAAQEEGSLTVYDSTGKIKEIGENFEKKYGIDTEAVKMHDPDAMDKLTREAQSGNITIDLDFITDVPAIVGQLLPQGIVTSWVPPDVEQYVDPTQRDPLVVVTDSEVLTYNTDSYPDGCPVDNIWQLTDPEWTGKVAMLDPLAKSKIIGFLIDLTLGGSDQLAEAYEDQYGSALQTDEENAGWEFIKRLAANSPVMFSSSEDVSGAIGAPGQESAPIGLMSPAKFRNNADKGYKLGLCTDVTPWIGYAAPKAAVIATGAKHPNAAKLFIHYVMTPEGIAPQVVDAKFSSNSQIEPDPDDPSGLGQYRDRLYYFDNANAEKSWSIRQDVQDFWRINNQ